MNKNEIRKEYHNIVKENEPEIWDRIESQLEEKEDASAQPENKKVFPIRKYLMRATAACAGICLVVFAGSIINNMTRYSTEYDYVDNGNSLYENVQDDSFMFRKSADMGSTQEYSSETESAYAEEYDSSYEESGTKYSADGESIENVKQQNKRKLIKKVTLDVEAVEFDAFLDQMKKQTEQLEGYIETFDVSSREYVNSRYQTATIVLRIPCDKSDEILESIGTQVNILSQSEKVEDVTLTYVDLESHIKALEIEKEQLLNLLENAETVDEMISIQAYLADVRYELESYASQLKTYDNLVAYDTITLYVKEVVKETPTGEASIFEQMKEGFLQSLDQVKEGILVFCVWFVSSIPHLALFGVFIFVIVAIIRKIRKR